jgi:hypothetical protein
VSRTPHRESHDRPTWHAGFLAMLPVIKLHARISFRHLDREAREEAVQNCIANAAIAYAKLHELGKVDVAYPSVLARYAVAQTKDFRVVGSQLNVQDVSSRHCQKRKHISMERLDHYDNTEDAWLEILLEDKHAGPADIVRVKLDFAAWLRSLPTRLRRIAKFLANGGRTTDVAKKFGLSNGRISQIRRELALNWRKFTGEEPGGAAVAA